MSNDGAHVLLDLGELAEMARQNQAPAGPIRSYAAQNTWGEVSLNQMWERLQSLMGIPNPDPSVAFILDVDFDLPPETANGDFA